MIPSENLLLYNRHLIAYMLMQSGSKLIYKNEKEVKRFHDNFLYSQYSDTKSITFGRFTNLR